MLHGKMVKALAVAGLLAVPGMVMAQDAKPVNSGKVNLTLGVDMVSQYFFRGIVNQEKGIILQPYADVAFKLWQGDGPINSIALNTGIWNSFSDHHTVGGESVTWQEADLYAGVSVGFADKFTLSAVYQVYKYPDLASPADEQELQFKLAFNDSDLFGPFAMSPYVMYAVEVENNDAEERQYLEVGVAPGLDLVKEGDFPIRLTMPIVAGFSLDGYYLQDATGSNETWGYASVGAFVSMPIKAIPADFGVWTLTAGPQFILINDRINEGANQGGNDNEIIAKVGLSMAY